MTMGQFFLFLSFVGILLSGGCSSEDSSPLVPANLTPEGVVDHIYTEIWNKGKVDLADGLIAPNYIGRYVGFPNIPGPDRFKGFVVLIRNSFDGLNFTVEDILVEGDMVVARWSLHGFHTDDFLGVPPTGEEVGIRGVSFYRMVGNLVAEEWFQFDRLGFLQQLGIVPAAGAAKTSPRVGQRPSATLQESGAPKLIVGRLFEEIWNGKNLALADELVSPAYVNFFVGFGGIPSVTGIKTFVSSLHDSFSGLQFTIEDMVGQGDKVAVRWILRGTHTGTFQGIEPTGADINVAGVSFIGTAFGKIEDEWFHMDQLGLLQQIGVVPPSG